MCLGSGGAMLHVFMRDEMLFLCYGGEIETASVVADKKILR